MKPKRIQLRRTCGWKKPANAVVITRPSRFANPFVGEDAVPAFERWLADGGLAQDIDTSDLRVDLKPKYRKRRGADVVKFAKELLRGKDVACFCKLENDCHGDVLLRIVLNGN